jgi:hypothetical protein
MNKKIVAMLAATVAAVGSVIVTAPAHAQTATLPVTVTVQPRLVLRTYSALNFVVNQQDLLGGKSLDQDAGAYNEAGTTAPLSTTTPGGTAPKDTITKTIPNLYQVWGGGANTTVNIIASTPTLTTSTTAGGGGFGGTTPPATDTVTMAVTSGNGVKATAPVTGTPFVGGVGLSLKFNSGSTPGASTSYTGGQLTISIVNN